MPHIISGTQQSSSCISSQFPQPIASSAKKTSQANASKTSVQSFEATLNRQMEETMQETIAGSNITSVSGCQFKIFNGPVKIIRESRKRPLRNESDEED